MEVCNFKFILLMAIYCGTLTSKPSSDVNSRNIEIMSSFDGTNTIPNNANITEDDDNNNKSSNVRYDLSNETSNGSGSSESPGSTVTSDETNTTKNGDIREYIKNNFNSLLETFTGFVKNGFDKEQRGTKVSSDDDINNDTVPLLPKKTNQNHDLDKRLNDSDGMMISPDDTIIELDERGDRSLSSDESNRIDNPAEEKKHDTHGDITTPSILLPNEKKSDVLPDQKLNKNSNDTINESIDKELPRGDTNNADILIHTELTTKTPSNKDQDVRTSSGPSPSTVPVHENTEGNSLDDHKTNVPHEIPTSNTEITKDSVIDYYAVGDEVDTSFNDDSITDVDDVVVYADVSLIPLNDPSKLIIVILIPIAFCVVSIMTVSFGVSNIRSQSTKNRPFQKTYLGRKYEFLEPEDTLQV